MFFLQESYFDIFVLDCKVQFANWLPDLLIAWKRAIITEKFP